MNSNTRKNRNRKKNTRRLLSIQKTRSLVNQYLVLNLPKRKGKFQVETDKLEHAIEGVLSQEQKGKLKPIIFIKDDISSRNKLSNL